jgi:hypothetical protein
LDKKLDMEIKVIPPGKYELIKKIKQMHLNVHFLVITVMLIIYMVQIYARNSAYSVMSNGVSKLQSYSVVSDSKAVRGTLRYLSTMFQYLSPAQHQLSYSSVIQPMTVYYQHIIFAISFLMISNISVNALKSLCGISRYKTYFNLHMNAYHKCH